MLLRCLTLFVALAGAARFAAFANDTQAFQLPMGALPHDVAPAPEGKVWYSAQRNGALGILDPATGQTRQVKLGPKSAPHGVIQRPGRRRLAYSMAVRTRSLGSIRRLTTR